MHAPITRRDFLNGVLLGAGMALIDLPAPLRLLAQSRSQENPWDGCGGVGDYADSHGNTESVVRVAHEVRDGRYAALPSGIIDTGEFFDLVVVGGGLSGLGAAFSFKKTAGRKKKCLVLENHPVFGGEAKRNEFVVGGQRLIGPQGSNSFIVLDEPGTFGYEIYSDLGVPKHFHYQEAPEELRHLQFDRTNFGFMLWNDATTSCGYFFGDKGTGLHLENDIWKRKLANTPLPEKVRRDFLSWRNDRKEYHGANGLDRWLDTMTYKDYLEKVMGLDHEVTKYVDPVMASSIGLGCDAISAYGAYQIAMPGFQAYLDEERQHRRGWHSFPGGNDGFSRYFIKRLIPDALYGKDKFDDIIDRPINFEALDRQENNVRIRTGAMTVSVVHDGNPDKAEYVQVAYVKGGRPYKLKARGVIMANGSWVTRRIARDLPGEYREAYKQFYRSPMLVVNVALTNWRFLAGLGITSCRWFSGFGFSCNIRQSMIAGGYKPPLDPGKPACLTFYVPFYYPGLPIREQGIKGRTELLSTSYREYESKIRAQMASLFGGSGFDPARDIAGIILNRWGHAYVNPQPGFYFGRDGRPAPRDIIMRRFGRIAFAHSELNGHQHWVGAAYEGHRAAKQIMDIL
ncbi:MAG TPA: NAD(P)-binding protein [Dissulfurispiraceae bacterium]